MTKKNYSDKLVKIYSKILLNVEGIVKTKNEVMMMKAAVKTELKENPLRFEASKTDKEVSDVFFNDERIGDIGTNLTGLMNEYFQLYHETQLALKQTAPNELDKNQTVEELKLLVTKQHKMAADIIIYQAGLKAFNGFKLIIQEPDTSKRFKMAKKLLKVVESHLDLLIGQNIWVTEKNIAIFNILVDKLNKMSKELENYKPNRFITNIPLLPKAINIYLGLRSKDGKAVASTFDAAIKKYGKGPESYILIPTIQKAKKDEKKEKSKSKKAEKSTSSTKGFW